MLAVTVDVVVCLVAAVLPLAGADGRRARPVIADRRGQGHGRHSGLASQSSLTYSKHKRVALTPASGGCERSALQERGHVII